jgi:hypothetical protein
LRYGSAEQLDENSEAIVVLFFFAGNPTVGFLPIFCEDQGPSVAGTCAIALFTFAVPGPCSFTLSETINNFECTISLGIFMSMLFFGVLICVKTQ